MSNYNAGSGFDAGNKATYGSSPSPYAQPQYGQPVAYNQGAQPILVVQDNSNDSNDAMVSLIIFIVGWFCCPVWCAGWMYIGKRGTAKLFGILSIVMSVVVLVITIILIVVFVAMAKSAVDSLCAYSNSYSCTNAGCYWCHSSSVCYNSNHSFC